MDESDYRMILYWSQGKISSFINSNESCFMVVKLIMYQKNIINHFLKPLSESKYVQYAHLTEEDVYFLQECGRYLFHKSTQPIEAYADFSQAIEEAYRKSQIFHDIKELSQKTLKNNQDLYANVEIESKDTIGKHLLETPCKCTQNFLRGSTDGEILRKMNTSGPQVIGKYPLTVDSIQIYIPSLGRWLREYSQMSKQDVEFLHLIRAVLDIVEKFQWQKEIIVQNTDDLEGEIVYAS